MRRLAVVVVLLVVVVDRGCDRSGNERSEPTGTAGEGDLAGGTAWFSVEDAGFVGTLVVFRRTQARGQRWLCWPKALAFLADDSR
jgi:hypothetical protein